MLEEEQRPPLHAADLGTGPFADVASMCCCVTRYDFEAMSGNDDVLATGSAVVAAVGAPLPGSGKLVRHDVIDAVTALLERVGPDGDFRVNKAAAKVRVVVVVVELGMTTRSRHDRRFTVSLRDSFTASRTHCLAR